MKKKYPYFILFLVFAILAIIYFLSRSSKLKNIQLRENMTTSPEKKAVMIISFRDFRDQEYFVPKEILEKGGVEVKTASNKKGLAIGADGGETEVDLLVSEIITEDFDAIIFVGGPGCLGALDNDDSYRIAREAIANNKVLSAICISPVILAKAGVLDGKRATVWSDALGSQTKILKERGAIVEKKNVVVDGNIITANGPEAAKEFGENILSLLTKE